MSDGADQQPPELRPWPSPYGGYQRVVKADRRALRRRPLRRWEIVLIRVTLLLTASFAAPVLAIGPPQSLWRAAAIGAATSALACMACLALSSRRWLLQLVGLRPPAE